MRGLSEGGRVSRVAVCRLTDLVGGRLLVDVDGVADPLLVVADGDAVHVLDGLCPHQFAPLDDGPVEDGVLVCAHHGWRFALSTGQSPDSPFICIRRWPAVVEDGVVWTEV